MRMPALVLLAALGLAGCGDVRDTKIHDIDFTDGAAVQEVAQKLDPDERAAFGRYVMSRMMAGVGNEIVTASGAEPATVRDAIKLSEAQEAKTKKHNDLMDQRNKLVDRINSLLGEQTEPLSASKQAEYEKLKSELASFDKQIKASDR
jgi:hypothetical protein